MAKCQQRGTLPSRIAELGSGTQANQDKISAEQKWFDTDYVRPEGIRMDVCSRLNDMEHFKALIWEQPAREMISRFGCTAEEMADLTGTGWLSTGHMVWLLDRVNKAQDTSLCQCLGASRPDLFRKMLQGWNRNKLQRLVFVANVGKTGKEVYFATPQKPGNHWVLITFDLCVKPVIKYCDSLAWAPPIHLLQDLSQYAQVVGLSLKEARVNIMHLPQSPDYNHACRASCGNYPLQACSDMCGVLVVVCAVVAALDNRLFQELTGLGSGLKLFLHEPTKYQHYLRRVLICWFMEDAIDITLLQTQTYERISLRDCARKLNFTTDSNKDTLGHVDSGDLQLGRKRKATHISQTDTKRKNCGNQTQSNSSPQCISNQQINQDHTQQQAPSSTGHSLKQSHSQSTAGNAQQINQDHTQQQAPSSTMHNLKGNDSIQTPLKCPFCSEEFKLPQSLLSHKEKKHAAEFVNANSSPNSKNSHCELCDFKSFTIKELIKHYNFGHQQKLKIVRRTFPSEEDFSEWKKNVEKETLSQFSKYCDPTIIGKTIQLERFYCRMSGILQPLQVGKRVPKSVGPCKMGRNCTAFMTTLKNLEDGSLRVEYCLHHTGHDFKLGHLKISDETREKIAGKLNQGVEPKKLLCDLRENKTTVTNRDSLIKLKDLHNIKRQFISTPCTAKHRDDETTVELCVKELGQEDNNPQVEKPHNTPCTAKHRDDETSVELCVKELVQDDNNPQVEKPHNTPCTAKHRDDETSVELCVKELVQDDNNPQVEKPHDEQETVDNLEFDNEVHHVDSGEFQLGYKRTATHKSQRDTKRKNCRNQTQSNSSPQCISKQAHQQIYRQHTKQQPASSTDHNFKQSHSQSTTGNAQQINQDHTQHQAPSSTGHNLKGNDSIQTPLKCPFCSEEFKLPQSLLSHKEKKHAAEFVNANSSPNSKNSHCELCDFKSFTIKELINHYNFGHQQKLKIVRRTFTSEEDFSEWKKNVEKETLSQFSKYCGRTIIGKNTQLERFYCHRSGIRKPLQVRKRAPKSVGPCKMGRNCTAFMNTFKNLEDGSLRVEYCLHHTGHDFKLGHLKISDETREKIAGKLNQGVEPKKLLCDLRENKTTVTNRDSLIKLKDLHNIKRQFINTPCTAKHRDDETSVELCVKELGQEDNNPRVEKPHNTPCTAKHRDDETPVELCVKELVQDDNNPQVKQPHSTPCTAKHRDDGITVELWVKELGQEGNTGQVEQPHNEQPETIDNLEFDNEVIIAANEPELSDSVDKLVSTGMSKARDIMELLQGARNNNDVNTLQVIVQGLNEAYEKSVEVCWW